MAAGLSSVSAVVVVEEEVPSARSLEQLSDALARYFADVEIILVANAVSDASGLALKQLVARVPDLTCFFVSDPVDIDAARIVGMDHAIGDHVFLTSATADELLALPAMAQALSENLDMVVALPQDPVATQSLTYRILRGAFFKVINPLSTIEVSPDDTSLRLMTRAAALHILGQYNAELLLKSKSLGPGFPTRVLSAAYRAAPPPRLRSFGNALGKGMRALVTTSTVPLRLVTLLGIGTGALALLYSLYVVAVYLLNPHVQAGWTTISLQVSCVMFLFSIMFTLLAEYVLQIHIRLPTRRRYGFVRELRSPKTRRTARLNIVDSTGPGLGAPVDLGRPAK